MCVQYIGRCSVQWRVFSTSGGYHEYFEEISLVNRGMFSTSEKYHEYMGGGGGGGGYHE